MLIDPVSEHGDVGVDTGVVGVGTADSPRGGADDLVVEEDWSAGVTLAGVLASSWPLASAEHAGEDGAVVGFSAVAGRDVDDGGVDAVELVGVVGLGVGDVAPAANSDGEAVLEPLRSNRLKGDREILPRR